MIACGMIACGEPRRNKCGRNACGVYLPDLEQPPPPQFRLASRNFG